MKNENHIEQSLIDIRHAGVFAGNRTKPIHRWYPYIEGYSADLVEWALKITDIENPRILDPFGGSGTTNLVAAEHNLNSWFCEVNPFMAWMADVKINVSKSITRSEDLNDLIALKKALEKGKAQRFKKTQYTTIVNVDENRSFFPPGVADAVSSTLNWIEQNLDGPTKQLARVAVAVSLVPSSSMVRRTDLRRRTSKDPKPQAFTDVATRALDMIIEDLQPGRMEWASTAKLMANDIRNIPDGADQFDLIVTSPPYLNGTNYCRNTKLELLSLEFINSESGLSQFRNESITAGINSVSKQRLPPNQLQIVEPVAKQLDDCAYDKRLPQLVRLYFSDMTEALRKLRLVSSANAQLILDIGDSKFAGVHIATDQLLGECAETVGWRVTDSIPVRKRRSYDGTELSQVVIRMVPNSSL
jgi:hypothetical protein